MRWIFTQGVAGDKIRTLAERLDVPESIATLLIRRGLTSVEWATKFLNPRLADLGDPFEIQNMDRAVDRILTALDGQKRIVLYGDYDVDGVTAVTILTRILREYGAIVFGFVPVREEEGYGLSEAGLRRCFQAGKPDMLIAVDCGTANAPQIERLRRQGIEVIVLDHHEAKAEVPVCEAFINPKVHGGLYYLCSAGLAFKLGHALLKRRRLETVDLKQYLDLVALGTLSDLVALEAENRIFVRRGLIQMGETRWVGLRALMDVSGVQAPLVAADVGFKLGPRVNAAGRMGSAESALRLLLTDDQSIARTLAQELDEQNRERRMVEEGVFAKAETQWLQESEMRPRVSIVVGSKSWHPGVVGIVASRLMRKYHRPTFVIGFGADGECRGSGRSIPGLPLVNTLEACQAHLLQFGGHEMAAGICLSIDAFRDFSEAFEAEARRHLTLALLEPTLSIDAEITLDEVHSQFLEFFEMLAPFGMGNPTPVFVCRGVQPEAPPRWMKDKHLQLTLRQGGHRFRAIWFHAPTEPLPPAPWDMAFEVSRNEYRGVVSPQILVRALRRVPADPEGV